MLAQIIGIIDMYEALTNLRPYQRQHTSVEAVAVLRSEVERGWRRHDLVEQFVQLL